MYHYFKNLLIGVTGLAMMSSCNKEDNTSADAKDSRSALLIGRWKTTYAGENPDKLVPVMEGYAYLDEYRPNGEGNSVFLGDNSSENFKWKV